MDLSYRFVHVSPVGTSLLSNFQRDFRRKVEEWGFVDWDRWAPDDPRQDLLCSKYHLVSGELASYLSSKRYSASAELSPFERTLSVFGHKRGETLVILYSTSTCNSRLARDAIAGFLRSEGFHVQEAEIRSTRGVDEFEEGLVELVDKVVRLIVDWKRRGARVFVNATPGYKAEASFLVLASLLAGADFIYYAHEAFKDLVMLPAIPIRIEESIERIARIFREPRDPVEAEQILGDPGRLKDLELSGIITMDRGRYVTRKWIRKLLEVSESRGDSLPVSSTYQGSEKV